MKKVHCSTDEFIKKMESFKFIRTSLHSGVMCGVEYITAEPPEMIDGFIDSKIKEVKDALEPKVTVWSTCIGALLWAAILLGIFAPLVLLSFILR